MLQRNTLLFSFLMIAFFSYSQVSVSTQHNDLLRSGWNNKEVILKPSNVNQRQFGKVFKVAVDDQIYAQPLVAITTIAGKKHSVVYVATVNNTVYALDGDSGAVYWMKNYTPSGQRPPKNNDMSGACGGNYKDFSGQIGIVGTPVVDTVAGIIYFVARSITGTTPGSGTFYQYIHAVDIKTGNEKSGSPKLITATVSGNGDGNVSGVISFNPQKNNQRQALTLYNGVLYITFSSHCDWGPYHGWVLGYDANTLTQKYVYNASPNGYNCGIWQSGGGPSIDANGNMYLVTGNGSVGYSGNLSNTINRGESAVKLVPQGSALVVNDFYTPKNYQALENSDLDYGSMAAFIIPNTNLYLTGSKDGTLYLLNTQNLGGYNASANNVVQTIALGSSVTLRCQPSYYRSSNKEYVYVWSENSQLKAFPVDRVANDLDVNNLVTGSVAGPSGANGAVLSTSSNNSIDGTGIVWASYASNGDANQSVRPGILRAFDANDITKELWNSNQNAARDALGNYAKFSSPTIANGKVYVPTFSNQIIAYGIIDTTNQNVSCNTSNNLALNKTAYSSSVESNAYLPSLAFDGNNSTRWASAQGSDPQWIYVDLGSIDSICNITLQWEVALGKNFQLQVSNDAQTWSTVTTFTNNTDFINSIDVKAAGRYVRMYGTARGTTYGYSLYEFQVYGSVIQSCVTPGSVTVNRIDTTSAVIRWATTNASSHNVQYKLSSATTWQTVNTTKDSLKLTGLSCQSYYTYQVQAVCSTNSTSSYSQPATFNTLTCNNCGLLPTRIYSSDIGNTAYAGEACFTPPSVYNVKGSGDDIWNNADAFRFVYKTFAGDGRMDVKVTSQDQSNAWNKAGLMFRESLDAGSRNAFIALTSANGATFQYRNTTNGTSANVSSGTFKAPYYLRLVKKGTLYTGFISADSSNWTQVSNIDIAPMGAGGASIYAGLAVTSHDNDQLSQVTFSGLNYIFDSVMTDTTCGVLPVNYASSDIGATGKTGAACYVPATGTFKVKGAGADIYNNADAFRFVYKTFAGNGSITAKITSVDATDPNGKAGVMFRESLDAGARNVFMGITNGKGTSFQDRNVVNGKSYKGMLTGYAAPYYVRLVKQGTVYTGYISADSITWKKTGNVNISDMGTANTPVYAGIAVTSHNTTQLCSAVADKLNITSEASSARYVQNNYNALPVFHLFPNPYKTEFVVDFTTPEQQDIALVITGMNGKLYYTESLLNFAGNYHKNFNQPQLAAGTYIVSIKTKDGVISQLLIKQ